VHAVDANVGFERAQQFLCEDGARCSGDGDG
jgi:hypothetical protein